jgi:hypothetical protein
LKSPKLLDAKFLRLSCAVGQLHQVSLQNEYGDSSRQSASDMRGPE